MFLGNRRAVHSPKRVKEKKKKLFWGSIFALFFIAGGLLLGAWTTHLPEGTIANISVIGSSALLEEGVRSYVEEAIGGNYLGLFSRANVLIYPRRSIEEGLLDFFPNFLSASVSISDFPSIQVAIKEREPRYLWCGSFSLEEGVSGESASSTGAGEVREDKKPDAPSQKNCYFVDSDGVIFMVAPDFSGLVYFEFNGPSSGVAFRESSKSEFPLGYYLLPKGELEHVIAFKDYLNGLGIKSERAHVLENGDINLVLLNGVKIFWNRAQIAQTLLKNLDAAFGANIFSKNDLIRENSSLEYLDLRFDRKVYYRFN